MKKLILIFVLVAAMLAGCENQRRVQAYKQFNSSTNEWIYWYLLMRPNNTYYYYHSTSPVQSFRSVQWSPSGVGFDQRQAQEQPYIYVESDDFSPEMQKEFYQSENFTQKDNSDYKYHQSDDFNTTTPSTYDYHQSDDFNSSNDSYNSSESNDFGGSSNSSSSDNGSYNSSESSDFDK